MSNIFKIQYQSAKAIIAQIQHNQKMRDFYYEQESDRVNDYVSNLTRLTETLCLIVGKDCTIFMDGKFAVPAEIWSGMAQELFEQYEQELLSNNLIEYGDTLSDEQKLEYYYQQEQQQLAYRNEF